MGLVVVVVLVVVLVPGVVHGHHHRHGWRQQGEENVLLGPQRYNEVMVYLALVVVKRNAQLVEEGILDVLDC